MPTIEQLHAFLTTVETGSFSAAARRLGKVQSAISQHIMNMELEINHALFSREGRYPMLTAEGQALIPQAKAVIAQHQRLELQIQSLDCVENTKMTIAIDEGIPYTRLSHALHQIENHYPQLHIEILCASSKDIIELVIKKRASTGIIFNNVLYPEHVDFESLGSVLFDVFVSPEHPLAQSLSPHVDILKLHRQLVIGSKSAPHTNALSPDVWRADNYYMLLELTKSGLGWSFLPQHLSKEAVSKKQICKLPIEFEQLGWLANVDVIQHKSVSDNRLNRQLRQLLRPLLSHRK
ncbi:LysR family transcriptional regulator [Shewanella surugensis]|uniref:LysR family transcriptional regulator n=1 Tax=Shewanella surugensis TaxID=212020 RepID=A0ABT0LFV9_9GAMM|nr:LysR family transcriptional regulator [Shewanella surugensis]MCL1126553.1 LysR family transcriptional regulator [Shewanella surugensis]